MEKTIKNRLIFLAQKYEVAEFVVGDPSQILRRFSGENEQEIAAFIMALLSFGKREQFLKKAETIFSLCGNSPFSWIKSGAWQTDFPSGEKKFYRFFSFDDVRKVFAKLQEILRENDTFGQAVRSRYEKSGEEDLAKIIGEMFIGCALVPHTKESANKRVNMFLRWMVRDNSPVDLGIWHWFDKSKLLIPLDTHVLQTAKSLGLIPPSAAGNAKTARLLTSALSEIFPGDPVRGDFALFGVGVDKNELE